jgi:hypothetical protein
MMVETKLDFKKYLWFLFGKTYQKPLMIFLTVCGLTIFITSGLYFLGIKIPFEDPPYFQVWFGLFLLLILPYVIHRSARRNFSSRGKLQEKIIYEFTEERIIVTGETFKSEIDWSKIYRIVELKNWILIYQNKISAYFLPKESFGKNLDEFRNLVKNKVTRYRLF